MRCGRPHSCPAEAPKPRPRRAKNRRGTRCRARTAAGAAERRVRTGRARRRGAAPPDTLVSGQRRRRRQDHEHALARMDVQCGGMLLLQARTRQGATPVNTFTSDTSSRALRIPPPSLPSGSMPAPSPIWMTTRSCSICVERIATEIGEAKSKWAREAIAWGLDQDAQAQRLVILVDGLDHVETGKVPFLLSIQSEAPGRRWWRCPVIAAGRPNAIQGWKETASPWPRTKVALGRWRFIEPSEFEPDEAEVFLGYSQGSSRYGLVAYAARRIGARPARARIRSDAAGKEIARDVRTSADVYERALRELIKRT